MAKTNIAGSIFKRGKIRSLTGQMPLVLVFVIYCWLSACTAPTTVHSDLTQTDFIEDPTLDDFWANRAHFEVDVLDTGLPMGESDTLDLDDGRWQSYLHARYQSLGAVDQCGKPVEFPGCVVTFTSNDDGRSFLPTTGVSGKPFCQIACVRCPCDSMTDHVDQQQYPRVTRINTNALTGFDGNQWLLTYEYRASVILRRSYDGKAWMSPTEMPVTGIWHEELMPCPASAHIGTHPNLPSNFDCLVGGPPGIYVDEQTNPPMLYLFVGLGQNPGAMGCFYGLLSGPVSLLRLCDHNPLFVGASEYGPTEGAEANRHFDFRTISSAETVRVGEHLYLFYEGVRGPKAGVQGDSQFLLGLARSMSSEINGEWELYADNPLLQDLPGNVGIGHADIVINDGKTYLFTSLDGSTRSRLLLVWD